MAMVRARCCGFEIFYFSGLVFFFLFPPFSSSYCFLPSFFSLSPSFAPRPIFLTSYAGPKYLSRCAREKTKNSCLTVPECLAFASNRVPHCLQRAEPAWGDRSHDLLFSLGLRLPRCEMHAVLYLAIDFLMPAPVHRAPASVVSIDF